MTANIQHEEGEGVDIVKSAIELINSLDKDDEFALIVIVQQKGRVAFETNVSPASLVEGLHSFAEQVKEAADN